MFYFFSHTPRRNKGKGLDLFFNSFLGFPIPFKRFFLATQIHNLQIESEGCIQIEYDNKILFYALWYWSTEYEIIEIRNEVWKVVNTKNFIIKKFLFKRVKLQFSLVEFTSNLNKKFKEFSSISKRTNTLLVLKTLITQESNTYYKTSRKINISYIITNKDQPNNSRIITTAASLKSCSLCWWFDSHKLLLIWQLSTETKF